MCFSNLAINTGIGAYLGWNIVDTQASAKPPGRYRSKSDHSVNSFIAVIMPASIAFLNELVSE
jgi:hypothetical protein